MFAFLGHWREMQRFRGLAREQRRIVVYSEGGNYWVHLEPMVRALTEDMGHTVCYLSSADDDPGLSFNDKTLGFRIGDGAVRTYLFKTLEADVMVMTMPDLETYHIKRSNFPVHYVYVHHSLVSTHMIYRPGAFDHFDTIFCAGPHHAVETRQWEQLKGLPAKNLVEHGYGRLDDLLRRAPDMAGPAREPGEPLRVLIGPSWGADGLVESGRARDMVRPLLDAGIRVTVRPHPQTGRLNPASLAQLRALFDSNELFSLETDVSSQESLHRSDLLVSDWSGLALEYAYAFERPVLFVDVERKVQNPEYTAIDALPLEALVREEIGEVLAVDRMDQAAAAVRRLCREPADFAERIRASRSRWVYNLGESGLRGAQAIVELANDLSAGVPAEQVRQGGSFSMDMTVDQLVEQGRAQLAGAAQAPAGEIDVTAFLLAATAPGGDTAQDREGLWALCRKVDIARKVLATYPAGWGKGTSDVPLPVKAWPLLVGFFLSRAQEQAGQAEDGYGKALKLVNSALNSARLFSALDSGEGLTLTAICERELDGLLAR